MHRSAAAGNETPFDRTEYLVKAAADYLGVLRTIAPEAARVTDKMPFNFLWAGLLHMAFPNQLFFAAGPKNYAQGLFGVVNFK